MALTHNFEFVPQYPQGRVIHKAAQTEALGPRKFSPPKISKFFKENNLNALDPRFSQPNGAGTGPDNKNFRIAQIYI